MKLRQSILTLVLALAVSAPAWGQCSMCADTADSTGSKGRKVLMRAVAVLLFPTLGMMGVIVGAAFYRNRGVQ